ncbi:hypothetical protein [Kitasatospora sp. NPDC093102]|uniref:hypothetical protein n=1 Tax=Kitasatospora sp. NPDC093102 TaxID=3155069 RepID=UPI003435EF19
MQEKPVITRTITTAPGCTRRGTWASCPLLLWMGRYLGFKRLDLLLEAFARLRDIPAVRPALLVLGGFPGEWVGEHPRRSSTARTR